jgi:ADP-ribose pyrophosphatase YjhB (NUDIX family)
MKTGVKCPNCGEMVTIYRNPLPTADVIIRIGEQIVLIERKNPPFGWALPGGFIPYGESAETAAIREAKEETGLDVEGLRQFRVYSNPDRDPRHHTLTIVFTAQAQGEPIAGDDASGSGLFTQDDLPTPIAFDHAKILADYFAWKGSE